MKQRSGTVSLPQEAVRSARAATSAARRSTDKVQTTQPGEKDMKFLTACLAAILMTLASAHAFDAASVPPPKRTKVGQYLSATEAAGFLAQARSKTLFFSR